jgi:hypothetical protein
MSFVTRRNNEWSGVTGSQFEEEFISIAKMKVTWNGEYMSYHRSMDLIRRNQEPNSALCEAGIKFRDAIASRLNVGIEEVRVYGSLHTCLDEKHGVDMFIDFRGMTITVDLTSNPQKAGYKANVIVSREDVGNNFVLAADRVAYAIRSASRPSIYA